MEKSHLCPPHKTRKPLIFKGFFVVRHKNAEDSAEDFKIPPQIDQPIDPLKFIRNGAFDVNAG